MWTQTIPWGLNIPVKIYQLKYLPIRNRNLNYRYLDFHILQNSCTISFSKARQWTHRALNSLTQHLLNLRVLKQLHVLERVRNLFIKAEFNRYRSLLVNEDKTWSKCQRKQKAKHRLFENDGTYIYKTYTYNQVKVSSFFVCLMKDLIL